MYVFVQFVSTYSLLEIVSIVLRKENTCESHVLWQMLLTFRTSVLSLFYGEKKKKRKMGRLWWFFMFIVALALI